MESNPQSVTLSDIPPTSTRALPAHSIQYTVIDTREEGSASNHRNNSSFGVALARPSTRLGVYSPSPDIDAYLTPPASYDMEAPFSAITPSPRAVEATAAAIGVSVDGDIQQPQQNKPHAYLQPHIDANHHTGAIFQISPMESLDSLPSSSPYTHSSLPLESPAPASPSSSTLSEDPANEIRRLFPNGMQSLRHSPRFIPKPSPHARTHPNMHTYAHPHPHIAVAYASISNHRGADAQVAPASSSGDETVRGVSPRMHISIDRDHGDDDGDVTQASPASSSTVPGAADGLTHDHAAPHITAQVHASLSRKDADAHAQAIPTDVHHAEMNHAGISHTDVDRTSASSSYSSASLQSLPARPHAPSPASAQPLPAPVNGNPATGTVASATPVAVTASAAATMPAGAPTHTYTHTRAYPLPRPGAPLDVNARYALAHAHAHAHAHPSPRELTDAPGQSREYEYGSSDTMASRQIPLSPSTAAAAQSVLALTLTDEDSPVDTVYPGGAVHQGEAVYRNDAGYRQDAVYRDAVASQRALYTHSDHTGTQVNTHTDSDSDCGADDSYTSDSLSTLPRMPLFDRFHSGSTVASTVVSSGVSCASTGSLSAASGGAGAGVDGGGTIGGVGGVTDSAFVTAASDITHAAPSTAATPAPPLQSAPVSTAPSFPKAEDAMYTQNDAATDAPILAHAGSYSSSYPDSQLGGHTDGTPSPFPPLYSASASTSPSSGPSPSFSEWAAHSVPHSSPHPSSAHASSPHHYSAETSSAQMSSSQPSLPVLSARSTSHTSPSAHLSALASPTSTASISSWTSPPTAPSRIASSVDGYADIDVSSPLFASEDTLVDIRVLQRASAEQQRQTQQQLQQHQGHYPYQQQQQQYAYAYQYQSQYPSEYLPPQPQSHTQAHAHAQTSTHPYAHGHTSHAPAHDSTYTTTHTSSPPMHTAPTLLYAPSDLDLAAGTRAYPHARARAHARVPVSTSSPAPVPVVEPAVSHAELVLLSALLCDSRLVGSCAMATLQVDRVAAILAECGIAVVSDTVAESVGAEADTSSLLSGHAWQPSSATHTDASAHSHTRAATVSATTVAELADPATTGDVPANASVMTEERSTQRPHAMVDGPSVAGVGSVASVERADGVEDVEYVTYELPVYDTSVPEGTARRMVVPLSDSVLDKLSRLLDLVSERLQAVKSVGVEKAGMAEEARTGESGVEVGHTRGEANEYGYSYGDNAGSGSSNSVDGNHNHHPATYSHAHTHAQQWVDPSYSRSLNAATASAQYAQEPSASVDSLGDLDDSRPSVTHTFPRSNSPALSLAPSLTLSTTTSAVVRIITHNLNQGCLALSRASSFAPTGSANAGNCDIGSTGGGSGDVSGPVGHLGLTAGIPHQPLPNSISASASTSASVTPCPTSLRILDILSKHRAQPHPLPLPPLPSSSSLPTPASSSPLPAPSSSPLPPLPPHSYPNTQAQTDAHVDAYTPTRAQTPVPGHGHPYGHGQTRVQPRPVHSHARAHADTHTLPAPSLPTLTQALADSDSYTDMLVSTGIHTRTGSDSPTDTSPQDAGDVTLGNDPAPAIPTDVLQRLPTLRSNPDLLYGDSQTFGSDLSLHSDHVRPGDPTLVHSDPTLRSVVDVRVDHTGSQGQRAPPLQPLSLPLVLSASSSSEVVDNSAPHMSAYRYNLRNITVDVGTHNRDQHDDSDDDNDDTASIADSDMLLAYPPTPLNRSSTLPCAPSPTHHTRAQTPLSLTAHVHHGVHAHNTHTHAQAHAQDTQAGLLTGAATATSVVIAAMQGNPSEQHKQQQQQQSHTHRVVRLSFDGPPSSATEYAVPPPAGGYMAMPPAGYGAEPAAGMGIGAGAGMGMGTGVFEYIGAGQEPPAFALHADISATPSPSPEPTRTPTPLPVNRSDPHHLSIHGNTLPHHLPISTDAQHKDTAKDPPTDHTTHAHAPAAVHPALLAAAAEGGSASRPGSLSLRRLSTIPLCLEQALTRPRKDCSTPSNSISLNINTNSHVITQGHTHNNTGNGGTNGVINTTTTDVKGDVDKELTPHTTDMIASATTTTTPHIDKPAQELYTPPPRTPLLHAPHPLLTPHSADAVPHASSLGSSAADGALLSPFFCDSPTADTDTSSYGTSYTNSYGEGEMQRHTIALIYADVNALHALSCGSPIKSVRPEDAEDAAAQRHVADTSVSHSDNDASVCYDGAVAPVPREEPHAVTCQAATAVEVTTSIAEAKQAELVPLTGDTITASNITAPVAEATQTAAADNSETISADTDALSTTDMSLRESLLEDLWRLPYAVFPPVMTTGEEAAMEVETETEEARKVEVEAEDSEAEVEKAEQVALEQSGEEEFKDAVVTGYWIAYEQKLAKVHENIKMEALEKYRFPYRGSTQTVDSSGYGATAVVRKDKLDVRADVENEHGDEKNNHKEEEEADLGGHAEGRVEKEEQKHKLEEEDNRGKAGVENVPKTEVKRAEVQKVDLEVDAFAAALAAAFTPATTPTSTSTSTSTCATITASTAASTSTSAIASTHAIVSAPGSTITPAIASTDTANATYATTATNIDSIPTQTEVSTITTSSSLPTYTLSRTTDTPSVHALPSIPTLAMLDATEAASSPRIRALEGLVEQLRHQRETAEARRRAEIEMNQEAEKRAAEKYRQLLMRLERLDTAETLPDIYDPDQQQHQQQHSDTNSVSASLEVANTHTLIDAHATVAEAASSGTDNEHKFTAAGTDFDAPSLHGDTITGIDSGTKKAVLVVEPTLADLTLFTPSSTHAHTQTHVAVHAISGTTTSSSTTAAVSEAEAALLGDVQPLKTSALTTPSGKTHTRTDSLVHTQAPVRLVAGTPFPSYTDALPLSPLSSSPVQPPQLRLASLAFSPAPHAAAPSTHAHTHALQPHARADALKAAHLPSSTISTSTSVTTTPIPTSSAGFSSLSALPQPARHSPRSPLRSSLRMFAGTPVPAHSDTTTASCAASLHTRTHPYETDTRDNDTQGGNARGASEDRVSVPSGAMSGISSDHEHMDILHNDTASPLTLRREALSPQTPHSGSATNTDTVSTNSTRQQQHSPQLIARTPILPRGSFSLAHDLSFSASFSTSMVTATSMSAAESPGSPAPVLMRTGPPRVMLTHHHAQAHGLTPGHGYESGLTPVPTTPTAVTSLGFALAQPAMVLTPMDVQPPRGFHFALVADSVVQTIRNPEKREHPENIFSKESFCLISGNIACGAALPSMGINANTSTPSSPSSPPSRLPSSLPQPQPLPQHPFALRPLAIPWHMSPFTLDGSYSHADVISPVNAHNHHHHHRDPSSHAQDSHSVQKAVSADVSVAAATTTATAVSPIAAATTASEVVSVDVAADAGVSTSIDADAGMGAVPDRRLSVAWPLSDILAEDVQATIATHDSHVDASTRDAHVDTALSGTRTITSDDPNSGNGNDDGNGSDTGTGNDTVDRAVDAMEAAVAQMLAALDNDQDIATIATAASTSTSISASTSISEPVTVSTSTADDLDTSTQSVDVDALLQQMQECIARWERFLTDDKLPSTSCFLSTSVASPLSTESRGLHGTHHVCGLAEGEEDEEKTGLDGERTCVNDVDTDDMNTGDVAHSVYSLQALSHRLGLRKDTATSAANIPKRTTASATAKTADNVGVIAKDANAGSVAATDELNMQNKVAQAEMPETQVKIEVDADLVADVTTEAETVLSPTAASDLFAAVLADAVEVATLTRHVRVSACNHNEGDVVNSVFPSTSLTPATASPHTDTSPYTPSAYMLHVAQLPASLEERLAIWEQRFNLPQGSLRVPGMARVPSAGEAVVPRKEFETETAVGVNAVRSVGDIEMVCSDQPETAMEEVVVDRVEQDERGAQEEVEVHIHQKELSVDEDPHEIQPITRKQDQVVPSTTATSNNSNNIHGAQEISTNAGRVAPVVMRDVVDARAVRVRMQAVKAMMAALPTTRKNLQD